ncbi:MAG: hypothetical protein FWG94_02195 [Oscillospiraceae bacterium]|nr:hypothetical protein [Oscillospiraceae bacterium]
MAYKTQIQDAFTKGNGVLKFAPSWVPRPFNRPGKRLKLHPDDYYAFGMKHGAIVERWFSSVTSTAIGNIGEGFGLSQVDTDGTQGGKVPFPEALKELGASLIGQELYLTYGTWPMFAKFFDYQWPLFHHLHQDAEAAALVGMNAKPEHYFFPAQYNNHPGDFPVTYFGFDPSVTKEEVMYCIRNYDNFDTRITRLSRAFRLEIGTGWYTPPAVIHAPGSLLTYEPQWASDIASIWENVVAGEVMPRKMMVGNIPKDKADDADFIFSLLDWEVNTCADYRERYFRPPLSSAKDHAHHENWICYGNEYIGGKELTVYPGQTIVSKEEAAYGCVVVQGYGKFGAYHCEAANMIRFGQLSADEFFVSEDAAKQGVTITNHAVYEPLVILKHFGPNCKMPAV